MWSDLPSGLPFFTFEGAIDTNLKRTIHTQLENYFKEDINILVLGVNLEIYSDYYHPDYHSNRFKYIVRIIYIPSKTEQINIDNFTNSLISSIDNRIIYKTKNGRY